MSRTTYNLTRAAFIANNDSVVTNTGATFDWTPVTNTNAGGEKELVAGRIMSYRGGKQIPRSKAEVTITALTENAGTATATTSAAHGYAVGDKITVTGAATTDYNVRNAVITAVPSATEFSYAVTGAPADDNGGATAYGEALGLLQTTIGEDNKNRPINGQALIVGGVIYTNLLPDSGEADFDTYLSELRDNGAGFVFETYGDDRSS